MCSIIIVTGHKINGSRLPVGLCCGIAHLLPGIKFYDVMITECKPNYYIATIVVILEQYSNNKVYKQLVMHM